MSTKQNHYSRHEKIPFEPLVSTVQQLLRQYRLLVLPLISSQNLKVSPIAENTRYFRYRIQRNQAGSDLKTSYLGILWLSWMVFCKLPRGGNKQSNCYTFLCCLQTTTMTNMTRYRKLCNNGTYYTLEITKRCVIGFKALIEGNPCLMLHTLPTPHC